MKKLVFAVYDSKAETYKNPFMTLSKGEARRAWGDVANDKNNDIGKHPEDYTLFHIATFDEETGKYENVVAPESMGVAIEYVKA